MLLLLKVVQVDWQQTAATWAEEPVVHILEMAVAMAVTAVQLWATLYQVPAAAAPAVIAEPVVLAVMVVAIILVLVALVAPAAAADVLLIPVIVTTAGSQVRVVALVYMVKVQMGSVALVVIVLQQLAVVVLEELMVLIEMHQVM
jgi:hypothetical protein